MLCNIRSERALHVAQAQDFSERPKTKKKKIWEPCFSEIVCSRFSEICLRFFKTKLAWGKNSELLVLQWKSKSGFSQSRMRPLVSQTVVLKLSGKLYNNSLAFSSSTHCTSGHKMQNLPRTKPMKTEGNIWHFWDLLGSDAFSALIFFKKIRQRWKGVCWWQQRAKQDIFCPTVYLYHKECNTGT